MLNQEDAYLEYNKLLFLQFTPYITYMIQNSYVPYQLHYGINIKPLQFSPFHKNIFISKRLLKLFVVKC